MHVATLFFATSAQKADEVRELKITPHEAKTRIGASPKFESVSWLAFRYRAPWLETSE